MALFASTLAVALLTAPATLTLEAAIDLAQHNATEVIHAELDLVDAGARADVVRSGLLPQGSLGFLAREYFETSPIIEARAAGIAECRISEDASGSLPLCEDDVLRRTARGPFTDTELSSTSQPRFTLTLSLSQLLWDGGAAWYRLAQNDDVKRARAAALRRARSSVRLNVVRSFYALASASLQVSAFQRQADLSREQLQRARRRQAGGATSDIAAAERDYAEDRVTLARRRFAESSRRRALNLAMGRAPNIRYALALPATVRNPTAPSSEPPLAIDPLVRQAIAGRPEVAALAASIASQQRSIDIAEAAYWPTLHLTSSYTRNSRRFDRAFAPPWENFYAHFGLDMTWSFFTGLSTPASVQRQALTLAKLKVTAEDLHRRITAQVGDAVERYGLLREVYKLAEDGARAAEEAVRLASGLYKDGKRTAFELRDAELGHTRALLAVSTARYDIEVAREQLRWSIGEAP